MSISEIVTIKFSKQVLSYLLMFLFLFDFSLPSISFIYNKKIITKEIKRLIKEDLPLDKITKLEINHSEIKNKEIFRWIHSREFYYRGNLYDILTKYPKVEFANSTIFYVFHDIDEEVLIKNFAGNSTGPFKDLIKIIKNFSFDFVFDDNLIGHHLNYIKLVFTDYSLSLVQNSVLIDSPPPKML
jgi:hypothetical protein